MIRATGKEPTEKKIINLPDKMVKEIDRVAAGFYATRSDFLNEAIRTFTRERLTAGREDIAKLMKTMQGEEMSIKAWEISQQNLWRLNEKVWKYQSRTSTSVTAYITGYQLNVIQICFVSDGGPIHSLQDYARLAAAVQVEKLDEERKFADTIRMRLTGRTPARSAAGTRGSALPGRAEGWFPRRLPHTPVPRVGWICVQNHPLDAVWDIFSDM